MTTTHTIIPGQLDAAMLEQAAAGGARWAISPEADARIAASVQAVRDLVAQHAAVYGINTGFGKLAQTRIWRSCSATWCCRTARASASR